MSNSFDVRKQKQRAVSDAIRELAHVADRSKSLLRVLQGSLTPHPRSGKPAGPGDRYDGPAFLEAGVDRLLSGEAPPETLLAELDFLDAEASAWKRAIAELRTVVSSQVDGPAAGRSRNAGRSTRVEPPYRGAAPTPCEADDQYWYL
jgi:hypothetical protein